MTRKLLQLDFPFAGPWGKDMCEALRPLAEDIAKEPGLIWKIWTENADTQEAGGIYLFEDDASRERYLAKHTARLTSFGINAYRARCFDVPDELTRMTRGPV